MIRYLRISVAFLALALPLGAQETVPVYFFGDSITAGFGDSGVSCLDPRTFGGYPDRVRRQLRDRFGEEIQVHNRGFCGETTASGLTRVERVLDEAQGKRVLVLMEGTNDISSGFSVETIRYNLSEMARKADERQVETVLASIIHRGPTGGRDSNNALAYNLTRAIEAEAAATGRPFANPFDLFDSIPRPGLFDIYYADPFHPNALGYDLLAGTFVTPVLDAVNRTIPEPEICNVGGLLCLNQERFSIVVDWVDQLGRSGTGKAVPLTPDTGYFWFNSASNVELVIKVLDGRANNDHFWVFYGALSNFSYSITITDTQTGAIRVYQNPLGNFASVGDILAFSDSDPPSDPDDPAVDFEDPTEIPDGFGLAAPGNRLATPGTRGMSAPCIPDELRLCLNQERFAVEVSWRDRRDRTGVGTAHHLSTDTGTFWFFKETNVELILKVLDGRNSNGHFWVFYGALSNVAFQITVTDTETGEVKIYDNPLGTFASVGDIEAFAADP